MKVRPWLVLALAALTLAACSTAPKKNLALERVRAQLDQLKADEELRGYAPSALGEAERALRVAEQSTGQENLRIHLVYMAGKQIEIARVIAQREQLQQEYHALESDRTDMLVKAGQLETERARAEAEQARLLFAASAEEAERQRQEKEAALQQGAEQARNAELAMEEAEQARRLAESRASEVELARREADLAIQQADTLRQQLENLQLRQTESGVVVTLGDVLFETGQSVLLESSHSSLVEVVDLLQSEPDKKIRIEGHTDSVGGAEANLELSQQRADAVREALVELGLDPERVVAVGLGEDFPIASNEDEDGRSRNRRVDVILLDDQ
jgi:outer membrane protein OmpA-like peptidoglycan-associated protein